ncbi:MAG: sulfite exporter TauE/SafE family protein [Acidobacteria bacterium]|nr:MAG: sulfite exporter TauE/SafE family protein [Acidobacteriota bacterium]
MTGLALGVLAASLLGSLHCAAMCGPLLAWSVASARAPGPLPHAAYHCGRLVSYAALGWLAGGAGSVVDLGGALFGVHRAALVLAGTGLILFGLVQLSGGRGLDRLPLVRGASRALAAAAGRLGGVPPLPRAAALGILSALLPCGWLYAFVLTAAGAGSAAGGLAVMAVFWAGTVPALAGIGAGLSFARPLLRRAPRLAAAALVAVGLLALASRWHHAPAPAAAAPPRAAATAENAVRR